MRFETNVLTLAVTFAVNIRQIQILNKFLPKGISQLRADFSLKSSNVKGYYTSI